MNKISYCITCCQEITEIQKLIPHIQRFKRECDEIIVEFDEKNGSNEVREYLETIENITLIRADFNNDFASFKNNMFSYLADDCTHVMFLDADELPHHLLLSYLPDIIDGNPNVDLFWIPRINTLEGENVEEYVRSQGWTINDKQWVNYPDYQGRLVKNKPSFRYKGVVHETIQGAEIYSSLPQEEYLSLYHHKTLIRQQQQNQLYDKL